MPLDEWQLGSIAYAAYCKTTNWKSAITGADLPPFKDTPEAVQKGWIAAAQEVKNYLIGQPVEYAE